MSQHTYNAHGNSVLDRYKEKLASANLNKCSMRACTALGEGSVKFVLTASSPIDASSAQRFVMDQTESRLLPISASLVASSSKDNSGRYNATIIAHKAALLTQEYNPTDVSKVCMSAKANTYLDTTDNSTWARQEINGKQCLVRKNEEDVDSLVRSLTSMTANSVKDDANNYAVIPSAGEVVKFVAFSPEGVPFIDHGFVKEVTASSVSVEKRVHDEASKKMFGITKDIPIHAVLQSIPMTAAGTTREDVIEYMVKAFGPGMKDVLEKTCAFDLNSSQNGFIQE